MTGQPTSPPPRAAHDDAGAFAARCYHLADQLAPGPVRDALLALGRDYSGRARDTARSAPVRVALAHASRNQARGLLAKLAEAVERWFAPLPSPAPAIARPAAPASAAPARAAGQRPRAAAMAPRPVATSPRRGSRLFRVNALTAPGA
jgi:hypothetical protein